jgi:PTH1 family peptidyl-tRNA hydrolase
MKLIVGLGNPGSQYDRTRHNVGFIVVDALASARGAMNWRVAHESFLCDVMIGGEKVIVLKPLTYMNLSGRAVASARQFYKLEVDDILIVVDDIALPVGTIRMRPSGSDGGHNGLKSIAAAFGSQNYARLRIGVDAPGRVPQKDYVLEPFSSVQRAKIGPAIDRACDAITLWVERGTQAAMNVCNVEPG